MAGKGRARNISNGPREVIEVTEQRHWHEAKFHDWMATKGDRQRAYFYRWGLSERANGYGYRQLGDLPGKRVLDLGCGKGETLLRLGRDGARAVGIDISSEMVRMASENARRSGLSNVQVFKMPAEQLDFADASFDAVYSLAVAHHLEIERAAREIARVLKPGGRAVLVEPLNYNPLINLFRLVTPWRRTRDEKPLDVQDLGILCEPFSEIHQANFGLASLVAVFLPIKPIFRLALRALEPLDDWLLSHWPGLEKYCWITVVTLIR